ncbi:MAG: A24 family peptidase [Balneolaceae bacterium]
MPGLELSLILFIGGICSYLSFWRPDLLSPNISSTNSRLKKWVEALFSLSVITALYLLSPPEQLLDWVNYGVFVWLLYIAIIDAQTKIIPNRVVLLGLLSWLLLIPINFELNQILSAIGVLVGSVLINYVSDYLFRQKGFGWGDVKLFVVLALFMGTQVFAILYIAILLGGLYGIALKLSSKYNKNEHLAFSPFIIIAYMLVRTLTI